jgi:23S rRNA (cytidine1920-2'-O)/16S rRNA (cytidine1409-2'-O)-methyltransferase
LTERQPRTRLDALVVERKLAESRARAQAIILGGGVSVDGVVTTKPGAAVHPDSTIALVSQPLPYVSRGGLKLERALDAFDVHVQGVTAMDVGASTGGFTDVLLQRGAARVYAIDVGYGQLAWVLRNDPRVVVMERTNIRHVQSLPERIQLAVVDVSFISLGTVLPAFSPLLTDQADVVALVKPQFEAGRGQVGKKGVVRDPLVWRRVLSDVLSAALAAGWHLAGLERSPILGPAGNVEFLAYLRRGIDLPLADLQVAIQRVIDSPT